MLFAALLALTALAAGLLAWRSMGDVARSWLPRLWPVSSCCCNQHGAKQAPSSQQCPAAVAVSQTSQLRKLRVCGLALGNGNSAATAVQQLFQMLLGPAACIPPLLTGIPWLTPGGRWAVTVQVPANVGRALRSSQHRLAASPATAQVSIYHNQRRRPRRHVGPATSTVPPTYRSPPRGPDPTQRQQQQQPSFGGWVVGGLPLWSSLGLAPLCLAGPGHPSGEPLGAWPTTMRDFQPAQLQLQPLTQAGATPPHLPVGETPGGGSGTNQPAAVPSRAEPATIPPQAQEGSGIVCASAVLVGACTEEELPPCTPAPAEEEERELRAAPFSFSPPPAPTRPKRPSAERAALQQRMERWLEEGQASREFATRVLAILNPPEVANQPAGPALVPDSPQPSATPVPAQPAMPAATLDSVQQPPAPTPPQQPADAGGAPDFPPARGSDWAVAGVLGHRVDARGKRYLWVRWADSWVPERNVTQAARDAYWGAQGNLPPSGQPHFADWAAPPHRRREEPATDSRCSASCLTELD